MRTDEIRERLSKATPYAPREDMLDFLRLAKHSKPHQAVTIDGRNLLEILGAMFLLDAPTDLAYLLSRLDKAEKVCEAVNYHFAKGGPYSEDRLRVAFSAWAKENQ